MDSLLLRSSCLAIVSSLATISAVEPTKEVQVLADRAAKEVRSGNNLAASSLLRQAIKLSKEDAGNSYSSLKRIFVSRDDLLHGERQVERLLRDRPGLSKHVNKDNELGIWAARMFAGEQFGEVIDWDPSRLRDKRSFSEHGLSCPVRSRNASIRIRTEGTFSQLWAGIAFRLHSLNGADEFHVLSKEVVEEIIDNPDDFIYKAWDLKFRAAQETRAYYATVFLPWASRHGVKTNPDDWYVTERWGSARSFLDSFPRDSKFPWKEGVKGFRFLRSGGLED